MSINLNISPRIIPSIATLYNDTNRIFMEYIDNSIDSAEEFYQEENNSYSKEINIVLRKTKDQVIVEDNCFGITKFEKVVQEVGNSDKKAQPWTNGQFGYGIYSFMAACEKLKITSKLALDASAKQISINRKQFNTDHQDDVQFPDLNFVEFSNSSGTKVELSGFDKKMWQQYNFEEIKNEIEKHFELLLKRHNLSIKLIDELNQIEYKCQSFDYDQYEGEEYTEELTELTDLKSGILFTSIAPITIYLKVIAGHAIHKPPVFISKGRRIAEIKSVKSFKSKHKMDIWGHPNITGYIDLSDFLQPTIARNDFKNNKQSKALFAELRDLESLILDVIKDVNKNSETQHYKALEDELNRALSKLAKIDSLNFRTEVLPGNEVNLLTGGIAQELLQGEGTQHHGIGPRNDDNENNSDAGEDPDGYGLSNIKGDGISDDPNEGKNPLNKENDNEYDDSGFKGGKRKKSGFNIQFVNGEPIIDAETDKHIRSQLIDGSIRIFKEHTDFKNRVKLSRTKEPKISQRLITYLAGEITVHYKDKLQTREGQAEYNKRMFENLVEFIYQFEDMVSGLVDRNLSDLGE